MPVRHSIVSVYPTTISGDTIPPGTISDFALLSQVGLFATLHTSHTPGDDGFSGANADSYRIAYSSAPIVDEGDWLAAVLFEGGNTSNLIAPNDPQDFTVEFMTSGTSYVAIRFFDVAGNAGGISNSVEVVV